MDFGLPAAFRFGLDRAIVFSESAEAIPVESLMLGSGGCIRLLLRGGTLAVWVVVQQYLGQIIMVRYGRTHLDRRSAVAKAQVFSLRRLLTPLMDGLGQEICLPPSAHLYRTAFSFLAVTFTPSWDGEPVYPFWDEMNSTQRERAASPFSNLAESMSGDSPC